MTSDPGDAIIQKKREVMRRMMNQMKLLREALETFPFWDQLSDSERDYLVQNSRIETYQKGDYISHTKEECKGPILVLSGRIRTYISSDEGREVTLYHLYKGDICALSASCLLNSIAFDVIIEAIEKTEVVVVPSAVFHSLQEKNPGLEIFLLRTANQRFSDVMWTMQQILFMGADKRVAIYLWDEYTKTGERTLMITHDELARYIGSAREVVTRVLKYFSEEKIVTLSRGKIEIMDLERLKKLV